MPGELREQIPVLKEILSSMNIQMKEQAGIEADDILGTMAKTGEAQGLEVSVVSGDRDLLQLATDKIKVRIPKTKGGKTTVLVTIVHRSLKSTVSHRSRSLISKD